MGHGVRLTAKEHRAAQEAQAAPAYLAVPGPSVPHPRARIPAHISSRPDVYLPNGRTLMQPRLPPLLSRGPLPRAAQDQDAYDNRNMVAPERTPPPDPTQHRRKRGAQWRRWQLEVIPQFCPTSREFTRHKITTRLHRPAATYGFFGQLRRRRATQDMLMLPAAVQLIQCGAFPCAPLAPTLAVDLRVLEFAMNLFLQIAPTTPPFDNAGTMPGCHGLSVAASGFRQNSLRRRFGNCLMWYIHLRTEMKASYDKIVQVARVRHLGVTDVPPEPARLGINSSAARYSNISLSNAITGSKWRLFRHSENYHSGISPRGDQSVARHRGKHTKMSFSAKSSTTGVPGTADVSVFGPQLSPAQAASHHRSYADGVRGHTMTQQRAASLETRAYSMAELHVGSIPLARSIDPGGMSIADRVLAFRAALPLAYSMAELNVGSTALLRAYDMPGPSPLDSGARSRTQNFEEPTYRNGAGVVPYPYSHLVRDSTPALPSVSPLDLSDSSARTTISSALFPSPPPPSHPSLAAADITTPSPRAAATTHAEFTDDYDASPAEDAPLDIEARSRRCARSQAERRRYTSASTYCALNRWRRRSTTPRRGDGWSVLEMDRHTTLCTTACRRVPHAPASVEAGADGAA
ncbi:hypothetical protein FB451DRAFT_1186751 [Mycena latifolia]|nr:hypothetical protein FB451DRAFT_1186751 [Mycena latifolia]